MSMKRANNGDPDTIVPAPARHKRPPRGHLEYSNQPQPDMAETRGNEAIRLLTSMLNMNTLIKGSQFTGDIDLHGKNLAARDMLEKQVAEFLFGSAS